MPMHLDLNLILLELNLPKKDGRAVLVEITSDPDLNVSPGNLNDIAC
ncbi:MAG: hypothetical protein JW878_06060 [Methanomicrobia archaeon]|nr:hypothetical protein [Methanomicrobia archaeon]